MILLVHLLFGAAIGSILKNSFLAVILAFLSHYFLDIFPHIEYPIENIKQKQWQKSKKEFLSVFIDLSLGLFLIFIFSKNYLLTYVCAFFAILPDGISFLNSIFSQDIFYKHDYLHEKIHYFKNKKISIFWRIFFQIFFTIASILLFFSAI